jgi:hypothetical protein
MCQRRIQIEHYCIYTRDFDRARGFIRALSDIGVLIEPHANRTRFWLDPHNKSHRQFYLQYVDVLHRITDETDHTRGV